jgi:hypothetical protein
VPVTWATPDDVAAWSGGDPTGPVLVGATAAANQVCFDARRRVGLVDDETTAPNDACHTAVLLYADGVIKSRGAIVDPMTGALVGGASWGQVLGLLGIAGRPTVDAAPVVVTPAG